MSQSKIFYSVLSVVFGMIYTASLFAKDGCQNPRSPYDKTYCLGKLFVESDKELNEVYSELKGLLKGDQIAQLVRTQKKWILFRDTACSSGELIHVECNYKVNKERADFLRDRSRECKVGHCRDDLMFVAEWKSP
jgi:uncharacterized protein YecT (DUF1311 family)